MRLPLAKKVSIVAGHILMQFLSEIIVVVLGEVYLR
jgi:hypothetical protein